MIDYNKELVKALSQVLPTYYELTLKSGLKTPCISYIESNNASTVEGDTLGYSSISYIIKVWDSKLSNIKLYSQKVDEAMRKLGFKRVSSGELYDNNSPMIQKIMNYEALVIEQFEGGNK